MKYRLFFSAMLAVVVAVISTTGAMAQQPSKEQRKQMADTSKKTGSRPAAPVLKPAKVDTAKKTGKKH
ncbi:MULTISPECIES: hypothetical protein [Chitinophaga]|uniref:Uncharacterized protein n=2 Tax=Chitinophaga TaxID=79328 RepID=A0A847SLP4_9BACT|nr:MULTISPECIES: hypothetical protein [Chitinophaga]MBC9914497.1 hypothetical protein [Chitinophaga varians]NLR78069.1 hypothetical protein [Chitinophaga eiseniae]